MSVIIFHRLKVPQYLKRSVFFIFSHQYPSKKKPKRWYVISYVVVIWSYSFLVRFYSHSYYFVILFAGWIFFFSFSFYITLLCMLTSFSLFFASPDCSSTRKEIIWFISYDAYVKSSLFSCPIVGFVFMSSCKCQTVHKYNSITRHLHILYSHS